MPTIVVYGKPLGQPRQRHANIGGRSVNYTPSTHPIHGFKLAIRAAWTHGQLEGPLTCNIVAVFPRPKYATRKTCHNPSYPHTGKPDWDNIGKAVCDALNGTAYRDDSQIFIATVTKTVAAAGEEPRVEVTIEKWGPI